MSMRVHVAAIARVDGFGLFVERPEEEQYQFESVFGKECLWGADKSIWDDAIKNPDKYLPMGSEGTLRMTVWINPKENDMDRYTVSIFGDLRDVWDKQPIIDWFKKKIGQLDMVRQAAITVNDIEGTETWTYDDNG